MEEALNEKLGPAAKETISMPTTFDSHDCTKCAIVFRRQMTSMPGVLEFMVNKTGGEVVPPAVLKLARQLLDWTQGDLAKAAGVSLRSLVDVEREGRTPMRVTLERLRRSLEAGGATFFADAEKVGVYVLSGAQPKAGLSDPEQHSDSKKGRGGKRAG